MELGQLMHHDIIIQIREKKIVLYAIIGIRLINNIFMYLYYFPPRLHASRGRRPSRFSFIFNFLYLPPPPLQPNDFDG